MSVMAVLACKLGERRSIWRAETQTLSASHRVQCAVNLAAVRISRYGHNPFQVRAAAAPRRRPNTKLNDLAIRAVSEHSTNCVARSQGRYDGCDNTVAKPNVACGRRRPRAFLGLQRPERIRL